MKSFQEEDPGEEAGASSRADKSPNFRPPKGSARPVALPSTNLWCILPRDVRTLTFCQLQGFPLNH